MTGRIPTILAQVVLAYYLSGQESSKIAKEISEKDSSKNFPTELHVRAKALLTIMHNTETMADLKLKGQPPNIRLHKLKGNKKISGAYQLVCRGASPLNLEMEFFMMSKLKITIGDSYVG